MDRDLTPCEARDAFRELAGRISSKADIYPSLTLGAGPAFYASIYPGGITARVCLRGTGNDWRDLLADCEAKWTEHSELHATNIIREMALAIISITADIGECTDAALRAKFDAADVTRYGDRACEQATEMGGLGPFSIVRLSGANDAVAA